MKFFFMLFLFLLSFSTFSRTPHTLSTYVPSLSEGSTLYFHTQEGITVGPEDGPKGAYTKRLKVVDDEDHFFRCDFLLKVYLPWNAKRIKGLVDNKPFDNMVFNLTHLTIANEITGIETYYSPMAKAFLTKKIKGQPQFVVWIEQYNPYMSKRGCGNSLINLEKMQNYLKELKIDLNYKIQKL